MVESANIQVDDAPSYCSQQVEVNQGPPSEKVYDSAKSLRKSQLGNSGNSSKRSGGVKRKSMAFSTSSMSLCCNAETTKGESIQQKEHELPHMNPQRDKQALYTSLEVIKKVMKMRAAAPFNIPFNPIAFGLTDQFRVIDTPMDFGTICSNLESGIKYVNSEDVYRDVQYIWDNCYKYNNKGDYILGLMKRAKKNFMKHWSAAGLYSDLVDGTNGMDVTTSINGKTPVKSDFSNPVSKKHHRQESEETAQALDDQFDASDGYVDEVKPEVLTRKEAS